MSEIKKLIESIVDGKLKNEQFYSIVCEVVEVDESNMTCDVQPINGDAQIFGVRIQSVLDGSVGIRVLPKIGSSVVVTWMNKNTGFVSLFSDVDKIIIDTENNFELNCGGDAIFNGGSNGGLILIDKLVQKINALENAMNTHTHIGVQTGGGASGVATPPPIPLTTQKSELENTKVQH